MYKRLLTVLLVGLNLALLAGIVFVAPGTGVSAAYAQAVPQGANYLLVTGKVQDDYDALYLIDLAQRTLHVFTINETTRRIEFRGSRDLSVDFGRTTARVRRSR
jgi:hypothetical protein